MRAAGSPCRAPLGSGPFHRRHGAQAALFRHQARAAPASPTQTSPGSSRIWPGWPWGSLRVPERPQAHSHRGLCTRLREPSSALEVSSSNATQPHPLSACRLFRHTFSILFLFLGGLLSSLGGTPVSLWAGCLSALSRSRPLTMKLLFLVSTRGGSRSPDFTFLWSSNYESLMAMLTPSCPQAVCRGREEPASWGKEQVFPRHPSPATCVCPGGLPRWRGDPPFSTHSCSHFLPPAWRRAALLRGSCLPWTWPQPRPPPGPLAVSPVWELRLTR